MKKFFCLILGIILIFALCSCNDTAAKSTVPKEITKSSSNNPNLKPEVISLDSEILALDEVNVKIIGASFDKATGDILKDSAIGSGLVNENFTDGTGRGFAIGFMNSDEEIKKMDAYLSLYFEFSFDKEATQRDSVQPQMEVTITDDQGENLAFIYNSLDDNYINTEAPFSIMLYKAYSDSTDFNININGTVYHLPLNLLSK